MKLSELYTALQERYPVEQEKKLTAEKERREELKYEVEKIIQHCNQAIEDSDEMLYKAYVKARETQEKKQAMYNECSKREPKEARIYFGISKDYIDLSLHLNEFTNSFATIDNIGRFFLQSDISTHLSAILMSYCAGHCKIQFMSGVIFDLISENISICITGKHTCTGSWSREECEGVKKFISDVKEIFPNSEELIEPDEKTVGDVILTIDLDYSEFDMCNLKQSGDISKSNSIPAKQSIEDRKLAEMSIDNLNLSPRPLNALKRFRNISTVDELVQLSEHDVKSTKMIGKKSFSEIQERLKELGLKLKS